MEKIAEDVYKISAEGNVYLYLKPEVFVIDASDSQFKDLVKKEIESVVPLDSVKKVLLTHLHFDHVGNLDLFSNAEVFAAKEELDDLSERPEVFFLEEVSSKVKEMLANARELGDSINELKVLRVPGHTNGSVAFLDEERKLLFSGDTLFENGVGRTDLDNSLPEKIDMSVGELRGLVRNDGYKLCAGHDY